MSAVEASKRLVARPRDEKLANTATENVIVVEGLRMRYGATEAVAGIDLHRNKPSCIGFGNRSSSSNAASHYGT